MGQNTMNNVNAAAEVGERVGAQTGGNKDKRYYGILKSTEEGNEMKLVE